MYKKFKQPNNMIKGSMVDWKEKKVINNMIG